MNICLKCGAELSPAGSCSNCGARLGIDASPNYGGLVSPMGVIVERSPRLDELERQKKGLNTAGWCSVLVCLGSVALGIATGQGGFFALTVASLFVSVMLMVRYGITNVRLVVARGKENERLRIVASAKRSCAQCHTNLPPGANICSNCGSSDVRLMT